MTCNTTQGTCLFLPETGFYPFVRALAVMGAALQKDGREVLFTRCSGQMPHCSMMAGHKVPLLETAKAKKQMCLLCQENLESAQKVYNFTIVDFADLHNKQIQSTLDSIDGLSAEALLHVAIDDCPTARLAQYDFGLEAKVAFSPDNTPEWLELFRAHVANTALAGHYAQAIAKAFNPSAFLTFSQYSHCQSVRFFANKHGAMYQSLSYTPHFNADCSHFWIYPEGFHFALMKHTQQWPKGRDISIPSQKAYECWQDVVFRNQGQGSHVYSSGKTDALEELFASLGLSRERKIVVAYTSSNDELVGAQEVAKFWGEELQVRKAFTDQIAWLRDLRDWAQSREDVQVVVRIHPREGKGKNYNHESSHLELLREAFPETGENFFIVWPEDTVSSYDLLELAHACVVPWTSVGMEAARVGVPVLSWVDSVHYTDDDFIQVAAEYEDYRNRLDKLLLFALSWHTLTRAVRYYHWRTFATSLDLRETVPIGFEDSTVWPMAPEGTQMDIVSIVDGKQGLIEYNLKKWAKSLPPDAMEQEVEANRKGIRLYIDSFFYRREQNKPQKQTFFIHAIRKALRLLLVPVPAFLKPLPPEPFSPPECDDYTLEFTEDFSRLEEYKNKSATDMSLRYLVQEDAWYIWHVSQGAAIRRISPLLIRLGAFFHRRHSS